MNPHLSIAISDFVIQYFWDHHNKLTLESTDFLKLQWNCLSSIKCVLKPISKPRDSQNSCLYLGTQTTMSALENLFAYSPTCKNITLIHTIPLISWWEKSHRNGTRKLDVAKWFSVSPHRTLGGRKHSSEQPLALLLAASKLI